MKPRDEKGRLVQALCPDPNCGGSLVYEVRQEPRGSGRHHWHCDGLTHLTDDGPLVACEREIDGPYIHARAA